MIVCIEDDDNIRELIVYTLKGSGFQACGFADGESFFQNMKGASLDLILLDIMLPGEDGLSILKRLRSSIDTRDVPIIILTARGNEYDKVTGLDMGADDYVVKPFGMMELISRVRALLRRTSHGTQNAELSAGKLRLNPQEHTVFVNDKPVKLTLKEFELLHALMRSAGRVLTRELLLESIWGYESNVETRTLDVHIRSLRQKLGDCGDAVETLRGVGYKFSSGNC